MKQSTLLGTTILVLSSDERLRSEVYASLALEGWEAGAEIPDDPFSFNFGELDVSDVVVIILESELKTTQRLLEFTLEQNVQKEHVLLGVPSGSLSHRLVAKALGLRHFVFQLTIGSQGPNVEIQNLIYSLLVLQNDTFGRIMDREVRDAIQSGALSLLSHGTGVSTEMFIERAHVSCNLANQINSTPSFIRKTVRLALFIDLFSLPRWHQISDTSEKLVELAQCLGKGEKSFEFCVVKAASLYIQGKYQETSILESFLGNLDIEKAAAISLAFDSLKRSKIGIRRAS